MSRVLDKRYKYSYNRDKLVRKSEQDAQKKIQGLTAGLNNYTIRSCVRDNANFKEQRKQTMKPVTSLHKLISVNARMAGTCPAVWFAYQPSNDRGSEIMPGSLGGEKIPRI